MSTTHTLPDGQTFTLQAGEGRRLGEVMLQGAHLGLPLPDAIFSACACHLEPATRKVRLLLRNSSQGWGPWLWGH